jgi:hypothetical protein
VIKDAKETAPHEAEARSRMVEIRTNDSVRSKVKEMSVLRIAHRFLATNQEGVEAVTRFVVGSEALDKLSQMSRIEARETFALMNTSNVAPLFVS